MYSINDLMELMSRLRDPVDGCPWDLQQNYQTIVPHTLEEVYEVVDTIERGDFEHLREELGDLLFQVVFYCHLASEEERFSLTNVIDELVTKLISRHPHVFPKGTLESRASQPTLAAGQVNQQWDQIKQREKNSKGKKATVLADVPLALPALQRAQKLQKNASKVGFDWSEIHGVFDKVKEEIDEVETALSGPPEHLKEEIGDALFALVNLARHAGFEAEQVLRHANAKFERRFNEVEKRVESSGKGFESHSLQQLDEFWDQVKVAERQYQT